LRAGAGLIASAGVLRGPGRRDHLNRMRTLRRRRRHIGDIHQLDVEDEI
jgi:hypothetical protein